MDTITTIEKEQLEAIHFPRKEVLTNPEFIKHRTAQAKRAMIIGNYLKNKVKIIFQDTAGMKMVETTVWGLTNKYILLKLGRRLPLYRVHEIIL